MTLDQGPPSRSTAAPGKPAPETVGDPAQDALDQSAPTTEPEAPVDERLLRALADLDNLRKRFDRELERARLSERDRVVGQLVEIIDDLDRALEQSDAEPPAIVIGVRAVRDRAIAALSGLGYRRFGTTGEQFDPARYEAVASIQDPNESPATVATVVRAGYERGATVVRPASVVVTR